MTERAVTELIHIALIDDDEAVLDSLRLYFARQDVETSCFPAAKDFLAAMARAQRFDCIVSDVRMPGMSGLELVHHLKAQDVGVPIILITGHGDVDMAVAAIKVGAFDFIEKPFDEARLLASIRNAVEKGRQRETDASEVEKLQSRFNTLSTRQRQVMELAVSGLSNKEIGSQLNISPKTVENHRAWVMERIGARNIAELVRIAMKVQGKP
jgi:two-component system response regulator FixJ